jgi:hypothetical protein
VVLADQGVNGVSEGLCLLANDADEIGQVQVPVHLERS